MLKAISYDRNLVQFYGAVLNVEQPMLVRRLPVIRKSRCGQCQECCVGICYDWRDCGTQRCKYHHVRSPTTAKLLHTSPLNLPCRLRQLLLVVCS